MVLMYLLKWLKKHEKGWLKQFQNVICADINDPISYIQLRNDGPFDGLVAMGVLQHMEKDEYVLNNMASF